MRCCHQDYEQRIELLKFFLCEMDQGMQRRELEAASYLIHELIGSL